MMHVMLDEVPDDPLARKDLRLARLRVGVREGLIQIRRGPTLQSGLQHLPGVPQATGKLSGTPAGRIAVVPLPKLSKCLVADSQRHMTPPGAGADDMGAVLADAA